MQSIEKKSLARIYGKRRGWTFTQVDFLDLAPRQTVDWVLYKLEKKGAIRRVLRGVYDYPQISSLLSEALPADIPAVAHALSRKFGWKIAPSGETALNILGITNQVPASYVFTSTGGSKTYTIGNRKLIFKRGMLKEADFTYPESALIVQTLRALGKSPLPQTQRDRIRNAVNVKKRARIVRDTRSATGWVHNRIKEIFSGDS